MAGPTIAVTFLLLSLLMKILPLKSQYSLIISSIIKKRQQLLSCFLKVLYYRKQKRSQAEQSAERQVGCACVVEGDADVCLAKTEVALPNTVVRLCSMLSSILRLLLKKYLFSL